MVEPFFVSPLFVEYILPFVLVFTLIFAILEKTKILGEDKKQVSILVGIVVGLIFISFPYPKGIVIFLMPFLALAVVILFVFMLLYGFIVQKEKDVLGKWWKVVLIGVLTISLIIAILMAAGYWDVAYNFMFNSNTGTQIFVNAFLIAIIAGVIVAVIKGEK